MRIAVFGFRRQPHLGQQCVDARLAPDTVFSYPQRGHALFYRFRHAHAWIERRIRILENYLSMPAARAQLRTIQLRQVLAIEHDLAGGRLDQPQNAFTDRGLAAAGLAHQTQRFAGGDRKRHPVHRLDMASHPPKHALVNRKVNLKTIDRKQ